MSDEDIRDPRVVPRWMEVGVSGVARRREWDAVVALELPELESSLAPDLAFHVLAGGEVEGDEVPPGVVSSLRRELEGALSPPYEVRLARRGRLDWTVAAREVRLEPVVLPGPLDADEVTVAIGPDGTRTLLVDGIEPGAISPALEGAAAELERRGRARYRSFAARAERLASGGWALTVDPL